jgi:hypothetical protein
MKKFHKPKSITMLIWILVGLSFLAPTIFESYFFIEQVADLENFFTTENVIFLMVWFFYMDLATSMNWFFFFY